jgi:hypothetical protein
MSQPLTGSQLCTLAVVQFFRENPDRWCRVYAARTAKGLPCSPSYRHAVAFCFVGAWWRLGFDPCLCPPQFFPALHNDKAVDLDEMLMNAQRAAGLPTPG